MGNRILKWWNDVMAWRERFEKLFPPSFLKSKDFQRAEMKKLEKLLSYPRTKLNEEERLSRKMVRQQYQQLVRTLYPNPAVRLLRNTGKMGINLLRGSASMVRKAFTRPKASSAVKLKDAEVREFLRNGIATPENKVAKKQVGEKSVHQKSRQTKTVVMKPDYGTRKRTRSRGV